MNKISILIISFLFISSVAFAQTTPTLSPEFQTKAKTTLDSLYKGIDHNTVQWKKTERGEYQSTFNHKNRNLTATFDKKGNWQYTSEPVDDRKLPKKFSVHLREYYGNGGVTGIHKVQNNKNESYYEVSMRGERHTDKYDLKGVKIDD